MNTRTVVASLEANPLQCVIILTAWIMAVAGQGFAQASSSDRLSFVNDPNGGYTFDTGVLSGRLQPGDKTLGLTSVVHLPSRARCDGPYGILSYYRVFTTDRRYGHAAWEWPCNSKILSEGRLQIFWPAADEHPFEIAATYRWVDPSTMDLETTVKAYDDLEDFEVFLASYFDKSLASPYVYVHKNPQANDQPGLLLAKKSYGDWQMFPRSGDVLAVIQDGRWTKEPNPVQWKIMPELAAPICLRRGSNEGPAIVLMAPAGDCFAISTPYEGEGHCSLYLSLFGRDIPAGKVAKAHCRLTITNDTSEQKLMTLHHQYNREMSLGEPHQE